MPVDTQSVIQPASKAAEIIYQYHETEDIHEIHLNNATQRAMKEFFQLVTQHYYATPVSGTTRILIRQTGPALPLSHFMGEVRAFINEHRKRPQAVPARFAIVLELTPFLQLIRQMLRLMRHQDAVTFFDHGEDVKAREWLQQSK